MNEATLSIQKAGESAGAGAEKGADKYVSPSPTLSLAEARKQLVALLSGEDNLIANAANTSAFINTLLPDLNWVGFYFVEGDELVLGPFQGQPACVRIPIGRGVCGACVSLGATQRVRDVYAFPGHIACDVRSRSELVVPIRAAGHIVAVLDLDSPFKGRFGQREQDYVEALASDFAEHQYR